MFVTRTFLYPVLLSTHPEFKVCHTTVPATKHNFKDTTDGPGYHHEFQAELPPPSNFKVDRQP
jgi:hypothetical protein